MKTINKITPATRLLLGIAIILLAFASCKKENLRTGGGKKVVVDSVTLQGAGITTQRITKVVAGTQVRLNGSGFTSTTAIYVNGVQVSVNPNYVTETNIMMNIPSTIPYGSDVKDTTVRNTIRIVTMYDDYTYKFPILGPAPVVNDVSHSLPNVGDSFTMYGTNLRDITSITFPGNVTLLPGQFTLSADYKSIICTVPTGATTTFGGIDIKGANGQGYSYNYMNHRDAIVINAFPADGNGVYNYGFNITGTQTAVIPTTGTGTKSPANYRMVPTAPSTVPLSSTEVGGFHFNPGTALTVAQQKAPNYITGTTLCNNLALQFDIYIPVQWASGWVRVDLVNGNNTYRCDYVGWDVNGTVVPVTMNGWQTVTMPLSKFSAINGKTVAAAVTLLNGKDAYFSFINNAYTDAGGATFTGAPIAGFQIGFGSYRIVPYVKSLN
jgi:hypothetical protein